MSRFKLGRRTTPGKKQHEGTVLNEKSRVLAWILDLKIRSSFRTNTSDFIAPVPDQGTKESEGEAASRYHRPDGF